MRRTAREQILTGVDWAFRLLLAAVFLYAAWPKMMDPTAFAKAITNYKLSLPVIGQNYVFASAILLPPLEAVCAASLLITRFRRGAALVLTLLLIFFTIMIVQAVLRGFNIDCGCFGISETASALATKVGWSKVIENLGLLFAAVFVYLRACPPKPKYKL
ncbi:MAG: DoxX family membrane protein [Calditrichaeota bacterium]|nr:DoxX family membrane protein [Calditrichota bacterium]